MIAMTQLEHVVVVAGGTFTCCGTATRVDARKSFTKRPFQLEHKLPLWTNHPSRLIPDGPPVHVGIDQVFILTACCFLTLCSGIAILADADSVVTIALSTAGAVKWTSPEFARRSKVWKSPRIVATRAVSVVLIAVATVHAVIWTCFELTRDATVRVSTSTLSSFDITCTASIARITTLTRVEHAVAVWTLLLLTTSTKELLLAVAHTTNWVEPASL